MKAIPPVLGFAAYSGTGKTTLLKQVIPLLRDRGLRIGLVKHAHHNFDIDTPGKDSYELRKAGASQVLIASHKRWALLNEHDSAAEPLLQPALRQLDHDNLDLLLVEGFKHEAIPKIELYRPALRHPMLHPGDSHVLAIATDAPLEPTPNLPILDLNDPPAIADFVLQWVRAQVPAAADPAAELLRYYRWLRHYGYNDSHSGNASIRAGEGFWVTPTGACADTLRRDQLIFCPMEGELPPGASLDAPLHRKVYQRNSHTQALLHSHGANSVAVTLHGAEFTPPDFEGQYYFDRVPVLSIPYNQYVALAPDKVAAELAHHKVVVVRGHGVYACAETLNLAYKWTCSLELSARTYILARQAGSIG